MKNPWQEIPLDDYENHMKLDSVMQLQALSAIMKKQLDRYPAQTVMILGIAGGNGLEHVDPRRFRRIYGVDINKDYLTACRARYQRLGNVLTCLCTDLTREDITLPQADLLLANLLIEYIGYECFQRVLAKIRPDYVSCVIQINEGSGFVSDSPYLPVLACLGAVHHQVRENELIGAMKTAGYCLVEQTGALLPNSKKLVRLDFKR